MTLAAGLLAAPLWLATAAGPTLDAPAATQKIAVEVRGPVALVSVTRPLAAEDEGSDRLLEVTLPAHAALVDFAVVDDHGKWRAAERTTDPQATHDYLDRIERLGVKPTRPSDDSFVGLRVRVAARRGADVELRYRFAVLPEGSDGRQYIRFPASSERLPVPADVSTSIPGVTDVELAGARGTRGHVAGRAGWELSWAPRASAATVRGGLAVARAAPLVVAVSARAAVGKPRDPPPNVLLVVDRSRSVGLASLSAERDLGARLLEALPPSTRFDALFFDRKVRRLFPMSRPATREALSAFEEEMVPDRLQNGTDLVSALRDAGALLRREASAFAPRTLLAIVTDGALPGGLDGATLDRALGAVPGIEVAIAVWVVSERPELSTAAARALRRLAATHGGILRAVVVDHPGDEIALALTALARGGDVTDARLVSGRDEHALAEHLAPGEGHADVVRLAAPATASFALAASAAGAAVHVPLRPQVVEAAWLRALAGDGSEPRLLVTPTLVGLVQPIVEAPEAVVQRAGVVGREVVRNSLSLAYMPRARACYLNRTAATAAERDLAGRVRLAIEIVRGEVMNAVVQASTLGRPDIEACLSEGAFSIEAPRSLVSDVTETAILNLVFRPRTPEKHENAAEAALGEQIDLVIEELHRSEARVDDPPPVDRSMIPTR